jgi:hypothetical protein
MINSPASVMYLRPAAPVILALFDIAFSLSSLRSRFEISQLCN